MVATAEGAAGAQAGRPDNLEQAQLQALQAAAAKDLARLGLSHGANKIAVPANAGDADALQARPSTAVAINGLTTHAAINGLTTHTLELVRYVEARGGQRD